MECGCWQELRIACRSLDQVIPIRLLRRRRDLHLDLEVRLRSLKIKRERKDREEYDDDNFEENIFRCF